MSRGRPKDVELNQVRENFYLANTEALFGGRQLAAKSAGVFDQLVELCKRSRDGERLAARRYGLENGLISQQPEPIESDSDEEFTQFGSVQKGERFVVDISKKNIFSDNDRSRIKTKTEFSGELVKLTYEVTKKPCCWSYGRVFTSDGEIKLCAVCLNEDCKATKTVYTENQQKKLIINICEYDSSIKHTKRKYITSTDDKIKINRLLDVESAFVAHSTLSRELINDDNDFAAHLPTRGALAQRQYRKSAANRHEISTIAVAIMKREPEYMHSIQDIGLDPFYVFFGSELQKQFLIDQTRGKRITLSIDATGINIKPPLYSSISESSGKPKKPFLYIISLQTNTVNVPIHHMISQRHSHIFIGYFLMHFRHHMNNGRIPHEIIMDESSALILACIQTFTNSKTVAEYMNACFDSLFHGAEHPKCYIRIDRAHFVATLMRNQHLNALDNKKKTLYRRLIGYLILSDDIQLIQKTIQDLFIVLKNEYLFSDRVIKAKENLVSISRTHQHILDDLTVEGKDDDDIFEDQEQEMAKTDSKFKNWIESIAKHVDENFVNHDMNRKLDEDCAENAFCSDNAIEPIINILAKLPFFSNIMNVVFGSEKLYASSACTEVQIRNLKSYVFYRKNGK